MNDVLGRIAALRARFDVPVQRAAPTERNDFSALLAAARSADGRAATASNATASAATGGIASLTDALGALAGATGVDTGSLASLNRLLQSAKAAAPTSSSLTTSASATPAVPAAYADYATSIGQIATDEGVPASLLAAVVWSESSFNPDAVSPAGARGLAQLMPGTAAGLGVDIDDPVDNLRGGARYLRQMLDRFGSPELALAAYNAGPNAVARADGIPDYPETQNYVTKVMARVAALAGANA